MDPRKEGFINRSVRWGEKCGDDVKMIRQKLQMVASHKKGRWG